MSDQREHGVGGLGSRDLPARTPAEPLVPSEGARSGPDDVTKVFPAQGDAAEHSGTGDRAGADENGADENGARDHGSNGADGPTRRLLPIPMVTPPTPMWSDQGEQDGPLDLSALHADDDLLTILASHQHSMSTPGQDVELKTLLQSWRVDVDVEPIGELVDIDTAMAAIAVGAKIHKRKPRYLVPLATAAAVLVVVFAGMGLAARNAQPGDPLWGLSQMLYSDHARSVEAAVSVRDDLHHASQALEQGQFSEARTALVQAQQQLPSVDNSDGKADLQAQQQNLLIQLDNTSGLTPVPSTSGYGTSTAPSPSTEAPTTTTQPQPTTTTQQPTTTTPPPTTTTPPTTTATDTPQSDTVDAPGQPAPPPNNAPAQEPVNNGPAAGSAQSGDTASSSSTG